MLSFLDRFLYNFIQMLRLAIFVDKFLFQHYRDKVMVAVVGFRKILSSFWPISAVDQFS